MEIHLTPEQQAFIQTQLASGAYASEEAVVAAALEKMRQHEEYVAWLKKEIDIGIAAADRGELFDGEEVINELLAELDDESDIRHAPI